MKTKSIFTLLLLAISSVVSNSQQKMRHVMMNGVEVSWHFANDRIYFEMSAPTNGWVTVGFNETDGITGAYLLMGRVVNNKPELVEHYTASLGKYKPITPISVSDISGIQKRGFTTIKYSLPMKPRGKLQKELSMGSKLTMILAYSAEDDFQHHSRMRTSLKVKL